jgi:hypothetical protein
MSRLVVCFHFTVSEVENTLLELDSSKGPGPVGGPPLIEKNCEKLKLSFVTPIFKSRRRNDISNNNEISSCSNCWCTGSCTRI